MSTTRLGNKRKGTAVEIENKIDTDSEAIVSKKNKNNNIANNVQPVDNGLLDGEIAVDDLVRVVDVASQVNKLTRTSFSYFSSQSLNLIALTLRKKMSINYDVLSCLDPTDVTKEKKKYFSIDPSSKMYTKKIGKKSSLETKLMQDIHSKEQAILREFTITNNNKLDDDVESEIKILKKVNRLNGEVDDRHYTNKRYVIIPYARGVNLRTFLYNNQTIGLAEQIDIAKKIIQQLQTLHQTYQVLHCDIKLENIIYDKKMGQVTLIDFDVALEMDKNNKGETNEIRFTNGHLAPEIMLSKPPYYFTEKSEIYALGKALAECFRLENFLSSFDNVKQSSRGTLFTSPSLTDTQTKLLQIIKEMIANNPNERPTLDRIFEKFNQLEEASLTCQLISNASNSI